MKGKARLGITFAVLALVAVSLLVFTTPTQAEPNEQTGDIPEDTVKTKTYSACGGIESCRTSCGCGCRGNPEACGCGQ